MYTLRVCDWQQRGQTELDFNLRRSVFWLDMASNTTQLRLQQITLVRSGCMFTTYVHAECLCLVFQTCMGWLYSVPDPSPGLLQHQTMM